MKSKRDIRLKLYINFLLISGIFFISCNQKVKEAEEIQLQVKIINDSLYTSLPGKVILHYPYLIWNSVFSTDTFLYITDIKTGKEIGKMGKMGRGSEEFVRPSITKGHSNQILVYDPNLLKQAYFSLDSLLNQKHVYIPLPSLPVNDFCSRLIEIQPESFVALTPDQKKPFRLIRQEKVIKNFGKFPIDNEVTNGYEVYQGNLIYNDQRDYLLYNCLLLPYIALYEKDKNDDFQLKWEKMDPFEHTLENKKLKLGKKIEWGFRCIAMTKDYIVTAKNETDHTKAPTTGVRNLTDLPRKIYIYDYDFHLKKIAEIDMQVMDLVSDGKSNTIYLLGVQESYCLAQCEL